MFHPSDNELGGDEDEDNVLDPREELANEYDDNELGPHADLVNEYDLGEVFGLLGPQGFDEMIQMAEDCQPVPASSSSWPFRTVLDGLLHFLHTARPGTPWRKRNMLALALNTPEFGIGGEGVQSATTLDRRARVLLNVLKPETREMSRLVRDRAAEKKMVTKAMKKEKRGVKPSHKLKIVKQKISMFNPIDYAKIILADPMLAQHLRFGLEDAPLGGPTEWNQTPFAHKHLLYQKVLDFRLDGTYYRVNDFVKTGSRTTEVGWDATLWQIDGLEFKMADEEKLAKESDADDMRDDLIPQLHACLRPTFPVDQFAAQLSEIKGVREVVLLSSSEEAEDVCTWIPVTLILRKVQVLALPVRPAKGKPAQQQFVGATVAARAACRDDEHTYYCRYELLHKKQTLSRDLEPYDVKFLRLHSAYLDEEDKNPETADRVLWWTVFIDKYGSSNMQSAVSYNGIYLQFMNWPSFMRRSQATIHTLGVLPPGVDEAEALQSAVHHCIKAFRKGFVAYDAARGGMVRVYFVPALQLADHMQAVEYVCHLGNNATRNARNSWKLKEDRANTEQDIRDVRTTRRWAQTLVVRATLLKREGLLKLGNSQTKAKAHRQWAGIDYRKPLLFGDMEIDPHWTCPYDPSHLFDGGYIKLLITQHILRLSVPHRALLKLLVATFEWPAGISAPTFLWTNALLPAKTLSWAYVRKLAVVLLVRGNQLWCGGINCVCGGMNCKDTNRAEESYRFFVRFFLWTNEIRGPVPPSRYEQLQKEADALVTRGEVVIGNTYQNKSLAWDRPNLNGILEIAYKVMPMLGNVNFASCAPFEGTHKYMAVSTRRGGTDVASTTINIVQERASFGYCLRGGKFRDDNGKMRTLGRDFLHLRHPDKALATLGRSHPVVVAACLGMYPNQVNTYKTTRGRSNDDPFCKQLRGQLSDLQWSPATRFGEEEKVTQDLQDLLNLAYQQQGLADWVKPVWNGEPTATTKLSILPSIVAADGRRLVKGSAVAARYHGDLQSPVCIMAYAEISQIVMLETPCNENVDRSMWLIPTWYFSGFAELPERLQKKWSKAVAKSYATLDAPMLIADDHPSMPIPVQDVLHEVMIVHACKRSASQEAWEGGLCERKHHRENVMYLALGRKQGFIPEFKRQVYDSGSS